MAGRDVRAIGRSRCAARTRGGGHGSPRILRGRRRVSARGFRRHALHQDGHRPEAGPPHGHRPAGAPGEPGPPDQGAVRFSGRLVLLFTQVFAFAATSFAAAPTLEHLFPPGPRAVPPTSSPSPARPNPWPARVWTMPRSVVRGRDQPESVPGRGRCRRRSRTAPGPSVQRGRRERAAVLRRRRRSRGRGRRAQQPLRLAPGSRAGPGHDQRTPGQERRRGFVRGADAGGPMAGRASRRVCADEQGGWGSPPGGHERRATGLESRRRDPRSPG